METYADKHYTKCLDVFFCLNVWERESLTTINTDETKWTWERSSELFNVIQFVSDKLKFSSAHSGREKHWVSGLSRYHNEHLIYESNSYVYILFTVFKQILLTNINIKWWQHFQLFAVLPCAKRQSLAKRKDTILLKSFSTLS